MKTFLLLSIVLLSSYTLTAQDITGQWHGVLNIQGKPLRLIFNVSKTKNGYEATMDSPDQKAFGIPVTQTTFKNSILTFEIANALIEYRGELRGDEITGTFEQNGQELPLKLSRKAIEKQAIKRPQEPTKPYAYYSEDVTFENPSARISLAGTLTLPQKEGVFPVVVLITGSGANNRDEELLGHKPFLVLSDYLTKNGIAVLRYDDRGVGQSKGDFAAATSADFATDVEAAVAFLKTRKEINKNKIGLIGHSEGGMIAPMVASRSKDISFIVLLAGTGIPGDQLLLLQTALIAKAAGTSDPELKQIIQANTEIYQLIAKSDDQQKLKSDLTKLFNGTYEKESSVKPTNGMTKEQWVSMQVNQLSSPWVQYFIKFNPAPTLEKVTCPVLAVNGEKDVQVPPKENLTAIKNALTKGGNQNITTIEFPNLNHLFQECKTGALTEYATIEQTFSPLALQEITQWIKTQTK